MDFNQTKPVTSIAGISFSAVFFGEAESLSAVCASAADGRKWIISPNQRKMTADTVEKHAAEIRESARRLAAAEGTRRYLSEALSYVRNVPSGHRSDYLDSVDDQLRNEAIEDVRNALMAALMNDDAYRAAVQFEARIPYLVADRGLIEVMDAIHADFLVKFKEGEWIAAAADSKEDELKNSYPFVASQVAAWKSSDGEKRSSIN